MFADTAKVSLKAGKGGNGAVSFRQEKYVPKGGPDGGDGGRGGNIIFRADKDTNTLVDFRFTPILTAENGKNGAGQRAAGRSGKDLILEVPIGTAIYRLEPDRILLADLTEDGQEAIVAKGGDGGFGNAHFKSSTRQAPLVAEVGEPGEEFEAELELKSMADVGLVGLPNAGKSTFLSVVSNATPEIADYPFTTLTPQLGVAEIDGYDLLIADIPGLIEGASEGKGLGHQFLRHVERTAVLLHLVDVYNNDAGEAYRTIREELRRYGDLATEAKSSSRGNSDGSRSGLAERPEIVALTKTEGVDREIIEMQEAAILAANPEARIFAISASAHQGVKELLRAIKEEVEKAKKSSRTDAYSFLTDNTEFMKRDLPTISLAPEAMKDTWEVRKEGEKFVVSGEKIEKFARRTDFENFASVNRLRDIMKKLGIRAELTNQGAEPESMIEIAGREFTLVEQ